MKYLIGLFLCITCIANAHCTKRTLETKHFKIYYTPLDDQNIAGTADSLESNYTRIVEDLAGENIPIIQVHFYTDIAALQEAVRHTEPNLPSFAIGLATSASEIHMLSPNHPMQQYNYMVKNTLHEFAHCVSLSINPAIANHPRWLWETVAIYEANQKNDPHSIPYLVDQEPPALEELNQFTNTYIYELGYFIAEYMVATKGKEVLNELIQNNGDLQATFNMTDGEFTKEWFAYVKKHYGI